MDELKTQTPAELNVELIRAGIESAAQGNIESALRVDVLKALVALKLNPETLGLYLKLLNDLVSSHKSIKKGDIEKSVKALSPEDVKNEARVSAADELVALVTESCELFTDQQDEGFASIQKNTHIEVWPINSSSFKDWVSIAAYQATGKSPRAAAVADAFSTLNGIAKHEGEQLDVHLRVASDGNAGHLLDICDDLWRVIHITSSGWEILDESPVKFRRTKASKPLPIPLQGGTLNDLKALVNVDPADDLLLVAALLDSIRIDTAYPVIELIGEQGSGKSTTANNMRRLVDPSAVNLRNAPKSVEDIFVGARNNHVVCLNNLSRLSGDEQDALCNLSTGGGFAGRKLYTNDEESVYEAKRPVILNGINAVATQPDLISRLVRLECPTLEENIERLSDEDLANIYERQAPLAMGFLLDTLASALAILPNIQLIDKPRLMDFAKLGAAVGQVLDPVSGERAFATRYQQSREAASLQALDGMPVIYALVEYLEIHAPYTGNYSELLKAIERTIGKTADSAWPKSARGFSDAIRRAKPTMNLLGWNVNAGPRTRTGATVTIKKADSVIKNSQEKTYTTYTTVTPNTDGVDGDGRVGEIPRVYNHEAQKKPLVSELPSVTGGLL